MDLKNKKLRIAMLLGIALIAVLFFRIYDNLQKERTRAVKLSQKGAISVELGHPERRTVEGRLKFFGRLEPCWQADVAAKIDGRVEKIYVREGDHVSKGQLLASLEQSDTDAGVLGARGSYLDAQTNYRRAAADLERYERLFEQGAISQQQLDNYRFAKESAAGKLEAARGSLSSMEAKSSGTMVISPSDGIIAKRHYQEGYYAKAGTPLFTVADISNLKTMVNIPEGQVASVEVGDAAQLRPTIFAEKEITGKIVSIAPVADSLSHTFTTEISVDNTYGLKGGISAEVFVNMRPRHNVLTVPAGAILMRGDQKTVFVADENGVIRRAVLDIGYMDGEIAEVRGGLSEQDIIVVGGQNKLREGNKVKLEKAKE